MDGTSKVKVTVIDAKKAKTALKEFAVYLNRYAELEKEFARIPQWRHFKVMKNLRKRELLTRQYKVRMAELGLFA
jgi:hypothetical protein